MYESDCPQSNKYILLLNHTVYFDQTLHTYACQHSSNHGHALQPFLMDMTLLSIRPAGRGQIVGILITLEPHGIF